MGSNRRYGSDLTLAAFAEVALRPTPRTLGAAQVGERITEASAPVRVIAWVDFPQACVRVEALAVAWTPRAVRVRFTLPDGLERTAWVWASAVERQR